MVAQGGGSLLVLVVAVNGASAIVPWYRYGLMRERIGSAAASMFRPGDLAISTESGLDAVLEGRVEQLAMKNLLYREGKVRGFAAVQAEVDARLRAGRRVVLYNTAPSLWALEGLNAPDRNPYRDRYDARDFEALLDGLRARYDLVPVLAYWEEAKEPLYLFGRRLEPVLEVRKAIQAAGRTIMARDPLLHHRAGLQRGARSAHGPRRAGAPVRAPRSS